MYTLRIIKETRDNVNVPFEQEIENFELGTNYCVLKKNRTSEFDRELKLLTGNEDINSVDFPWIRSILRSDNGLKFFIQNPTEISQYTYFVMTDNGKTFERL